MRAADRSAPHPLQTPPRAALHCNSRLIAARPPSRPPACCAAAEGILFSVRPPKKSWKNIANLSGGEKTLSSLSLVFALHHFKPTPLYVMDEIDAALGACVVGGGEQCCSCVLAVLCVGAALMRCLPAVRHTAVL